MEYKIKELKNYNVTTQLRSGKWVFARPMEWSGIIKYKYRIKEAIKVLFGKVDTVIWDKQSR